MEFWRYYRIIRRRRWLIILGMVVCVGAVAAHIIFSPQMYTGRTTLMESLGMSKEGVSPFPEMRSPVLLDMQVRLSNLASLATSNKVMQDAIMMLRDLGSIYSDQELLAATKVEPVRDTNILAIEVTLPDPVEAKKAADVIATAFKNAYKELNTEAVEKSREFIEAQIESTRREMIRAQNALRRFKEQNQIVDIQLASQSVVQRLAQVKSELNSATAAYEAAKASAKRLEADLAKMPQWQEASRQTSRDPIWQSLMDQLVKLEAARASMTSGGPGQYRRLPNHPDVVALDSQIQDIKAKLKQVQETSVAAVTMAQNPNRTSAIDRWIVAKVEEASADARRKAMNQVLQDVRQELASLPEKEAKLAELDTDVKAATQTYGLMRSKLDEAKITEQQARQERALKTIDPAYVFPVSKRPLLKLVLALLLSPILGIGLAFLLHYTDNTVRTPQDAEKLLGLPVHAAIPAARAHSLPRQKCPEVMHVSYQMLTSNLWIAHQNLGVNSVALVSAEPDVGRSITASNLAVALAGEGARVILVDSDFRQPAQHLIFGVDNKVGLSNLLSGGAVMEDVLATTRVQGLLLVPSGPIPDNPVKLLRAPEMREFVDQAKQVADFVIYDTPAGITFPDALLVAADVGSALVVHCAGRVPRGSEEEFKAKLESAGVQLLGAVLNKVGREDFSGYFHYYRSYEGVAVPQLPGKKS
ncbi:MAG: polysaccharide biosynthesis tyrosine autokinase [Armatimonadota bacterium]|nr:polysaccharide biosynthesis tyrosine autokinase [Armatimonadota bacterium]